MTPRNTSQIFFALAGAAAFAFILAGGACGSDDSGGAAGTAGSSAHGGTTGTAGTTTTGGLEHHR